MKTLANHLTLLRIANAPPTAFSVIDLAARDFEPGQDQESTLDWSKLMSELATVLGSLSPPQAEAPDPNWLKISPKDDVTAFPSMKVENV